MSDNSKLLLAFLIGSFAPDVIMWFIRRFGGRP